MTKHQVFLNVILTLLKSLQAGPFSIQGDLPRGQPGSPHGSSLCISPCQPARIPGDCHQTFYPRRHTSMSGMVDGPDGQ